MADPRNVAHAKKVVQQKHHEQIKSVGGAGRKSKKAKKSGAAVEGQLTEIAATQPTPPEPKQERGPGEHEKSFAILSKLKEMEFHSKANIETLEQLTMTIEEEPRGEYARETRDLPSPISSPARLRYLARRRGQGGVLQFERRGGKTDRVGERYGPEQATKRGPDATALATETAHLQSQL